MSAWESALNVVKTLAPTIATALGGPLAGGAVTALESVFGITPTPQASTDDRQTAIAAAISGATPEQLAAMRKADQDYAVAMAQAGFKDTETLASLAVQDRQSARAMQISTKSMTQPALAWLVIASSIALMAAVVLGFVHMADPVLANMIGNIQGYLFSEAKAVLSFYFGSSSGSEEKTHLLAKAPAIGSDQ